MRLLIALTFFISLMGCTKKPGYHAEEAKEIKVEELAEDIKIPAKAWDLLEFKTVTNDEPAAHGAEHAEASHEESGGEHGGGGGGEHGGGGEGKSIAKNYTFSDVIVHLTQKNEGIVQGEAVKIHLPKGGGTVDLSRYITSEQGSFFVGFEYPAFETATAKKVVFVSRTRKRKLGDQIFGAGCNQILDITDRFLSAMQTEGIKVNTTQERYVSVLGGTFLFSAQNGNDVLLAQVTFTSPQFQSLYCTGN